MKYQNDFNSLITSDFLSKKPFLNLLRKGFYSVFTLDF
jgi:hypothetical protein